MVTIRDTPILPSTSHRIEIPGAGKTQFNPTVCVDQNGDLRVIVRVISDEWRASPWTSNFAARVDSNWKLVEPQRVRPHPHPMWNHLEDLRLFLWQGRLHATAGSWIPTRVEAGFQQVLLELSDDASEIVGAKPQPKAARCEKNWMPCVDGDRLRLVYAVDPLVVLADGEQPPVLAKPIEYGMLHGGSQLVPWRDGWLALVHRQARDDEGHNHAWNTFWSPSPWFYLHHFARFDAALTRVEISRPFFLHTPGVEFCSGLAWWQNNLVAAFGVVDKTAWLAEILPETVDAQF
jgi:hypothetical protein